MDDIYEERHAQLFPKLTEVQIERVVHFARRQRVSAGQVLFEQGEQNTRFYVVVEGSIEVFQSIDGAEKPIATHDPGEFTGEVNMLSGRISLVSGRAASEGEVLVLEREDLHKLVQTDSELSELLMRAFILRRVGLIARGQGDVMLVGSHHSTNTLKIREFLLRNGQPHAYVDVETDPSVQVLLERFHVAHSDVPIVICQGRVFKNPSIDELAGFLGLSLNIDPAAIHDVTIVGAGPSGLAAAVYAASEGLDVVVLESHAPGGQAGSSSRIENYLGFPTGISGQALAARALSQAEKFGAKVAVARTAVQLDCSKIPYKLRLANGETIQTRSVVVATGAQYRKAGFPHLERYEGNGVYYGATNLEAQLCEGEEVIVVGGGNSAGQAAVYLSQTVHQVYMLVRGADLAATMSQYLIDRIKANARIRLLTRTQIDTLEGEASLEHVRWLNVDTQKSETHPIRHVFLMTGATPNTDWVKDCLVLDDKGFVKTGADLTVDDLRNARWALARQPHMLETSLPGVFTVGDARSGSTKRVASGVGEGAMAVALVHQVIKEL